VAAERSGNDGVGSDGLNIRMKTYDGKNAVVLVGVLWLKVILLALVAVAMQNSRLDLRIRHLGTEQLRCRWACRAGTEKAVAILNEDTKESDSLVDLWSDNEEDFNNVYLEGCHFSVRVIDEASKLNINTATKDQLMKLPYMVEEIVDAIIDWRDNNDEVSGVGAEGEYYETLPYGYRIRNGPFRTIRELLLVRGVTEDLFYGEDTDFDGELDYNENDGDRMPPNDDEDNELDLGWIEYLTCHSYDNNTDADGESKVNINQGNEGSLESSLGITRAQAKWIVDNRSYSSIGGLINKNSPAEPPEGSSGNSTPMDLQTFSSIADFITVSNSQKTQGLVNINTAPAIVLAALLGGDDDSAFQLAEAIVAYREEQLYGMESIAELLQFQGISVDTFNKIANYITTRSNVYTIRCTAISDRASGDGYTLHSETVVDRSSTPYEIFYSYQGANQ